ncbi:MAG: hypothetical protein ACP5E9_10275 [Candidatus Methanospirareceae archaeon]
MGEGVTNSSFLSELMNVLVKADTESLPLGEEELDKELVALLRYESLPFEEIISSYIELKANYDLERVDSSLVAINRFFGIRSGYYLIFKEVHETMKKSPKIDLSTLLDFVNNLDESPVKRYDVFDFCGIFALQLINEAAFLALGRSSLGSGILMRSAFEIFLDGMLLEHLLNPDYRDQVKHNSYSGEDTVRDFIRRIDSDSRSARAEVQEQIRFYALYRDKLYENLRLNLKMRNVIYWLVRWNCFEHIESPLVYLENLWNVLSSEVHMDPLTLTQKNIDIIRRYDDLITLLDILLVGSINTVRNLTPHKLHDIIFLADFFTVVDKSGLEISKQILRTLS